MISIVSITYNDCSGLQRTMESVRMNIGINSLIREVVIIDNMSSDGTEILINDLCFQSTIPIKYIRESDEGIYDAMNKGVFNSQSEYVLMLNSGDELLSDIVNEDLHGIRTSPGIIAFGCEYRLLRKTFSIMPRQFTEEDPRMPALHQAILIRRSEAIKHGFNTSFKICGDLDQVFSILTADAEKIQVVPINKVISRLYAGGISSNRPFLLLKESFRSFKHHFKPNLYRQTRYVIRLAKNLLLMQILFLLYGKES